VGKDRIPLRSAIGQILGYKKSFSIHAAHETEPLLFLVSQHRQFASIHYPIKKGTPNGMPLFYVGKDRIELPTRGFSG
jgi:hypothetical protein